MSDIVDDLYRCAGNLDDSMKYDSAERCREAATIIKELRLALDRATDSFHEAATTIATLRKALEEAVKGVKVLRPILMREKLYLGVEACDDILGQARAALGNSTEKE